MNNQVFSEIIEILESKLTVTNQFKRLYDCLDRVCIELTSNMSVSYNTLFTRLQALCRLNAISMADVDEFRYVAYAVKKKQMKPDKATLLRTTKGMVDAVARFLNSQPPQQLLRMLPDKPAKPLKRMTQTRMSKPLRVVVTDKDDNFIYAVNDEMPSETPIKIDYKNNDSNNEIAGYIDVGAQLNVVSYIMDVEGIIHPDIIVYEPDYLLDVSSLASTVKAYGNSPFNYLLKKFEPLNNNRSILMGNVANQFLDDCIYDKEASFKKSMQKAFHDNIIAFTINQDIDKKFFSDAEIQFNNIKQTVANLRKDGLIDTDKDGVFLEPSFFCEALGLQGRFDLLTADNSFLIELKSGKKDEFHKTAKQEHMLQMLLYKEVMFYNLGVRQDKVAGNVMYSLYPEIIEQRSFRGLTQEIILLRNKIVWLEQRLVEGKGREYLTKLTPDKLYTEKRCSPKLWQWYAKPQIEAILNPIHNMDPLLSDYFFTFLQFVQREKFMAKVGDNRIHSTRSMSALWNVDVDQKLENGDIIVNMNIDEVIADEHDAVTAISLSYSNDGQASPNFRSGDAVILYVRENDEDNATNKQIVRCTVRKISANKILVFLRFPQKNKSFFNKNKCFCIEHDYIESSFKSLYSGLLSLVIAPEERRNLLLGQRKPSSDIEEGAVEHAKTVEEIVDRADRANDFFLLVGPPGTGKTSVALKAMVRHFFKDGKSILLMAYTNRAVDEICSMMETTGIDYLRVGKEAVCDEAYHNRLIGNVLKECKNRSEVTERLTSIKVVVGTVASMTSGIDILQLLPTDVAIFDEASQILEPQLLTLLTATNPDGQCLIKKFIMIGDHKQLPAVVVQDADKSIVTSERLRNIGLVNCRNAMFERLHKMVCDDPRFVATLTSQGRMHKDIGCHASSLFYNDNLNVIPLKHQTGKIDYINENIDSDNIVAMQRMAFIDVPRPTLDKREYKSNSAEAEVVARLVSNLITICKKDDSQPLVQNIGVIVPFRRQIALILKKMEELGIEGAENILIDTVERFQGSQKDIIIYSTTISNDYEINLLSEIVDIEGTPVDRKLNVAITRARSQMFIVGSKELLSTNPIYKSLIDSIPNYPYKQLMSNN